MAKDTAILIRLTDAQKAAIVAAAERAGLSVSAFVLSAALVQARKGSK